MEPLPHPAPLSGPTQATAERLPSGGPATPMPQGWAAARAFPSPSMPWSQLLMDHLAQLPEQGRPAGVERPQAAPWGDGRHPLIKSGTHISGPPQRVPCGRHSGEPEKGIRCKTLRSTHGLGLCSSHEGVRALDGTALRELTEVSQALCACWRSSPSTATQRRDGHAHAHAHDRALSSPVARTQASAAHRAGEQLAQGHGTNPRPSALNPRLLRGTEARPTQPCRHVSLGSLDPQ